MADDDDDREPQRQRGARLRDKAAARQSASP